MNKKLREQRHRRVMAIHSALMAGNGKNLNFVKKRGLFGGIIKNPLMLFLGAGIVALMLVLAARGGALKSGLTAADNFVVYGQKIYKEYEEPVFGVITTKELERYLGDADENITPKNIKSAPFNDFDASAFDACPLYALKNYSNEQWIAVQHGGGFKLLRYFCDVLNRDVR